MNYGEIPELSRLQRLHLKVFGDVFVRWMQLAGWSAPLPVHVVNCPVHGLYLDSPHGWDGHFHCPSCLAEAVKASKVEAAV